MNRRFNARTMEYQITYQIEEHYDTNNYVAYICLKGVTRSNSINEILTRKISKFHDVMPDEIKILTISKL